MLIKALRPSAGNLECYPLNWDPAGGLFQSPLGAGHGLRPFPVVLRINEQGSGCSSLNLHLPKSAVGHMWPEMGCGASKKVVPEPPGLAGVKREGQSQSSAGGAGSRLEVASQVAQSMQVARFRAKFDSRVLAR